MTLRESVPSVASALDSWLGLRFCDALQRAEWLEFQKVEIEANLRRRWTENGGEMGDEDTYEYTRPSRLQVDHNHPDHPFNDSK